MSKKYVGGLTLFVFTFTFVVPLLIGVNTADAGPIEVIIQPRRTNFFCPDGTYVTRSKWEDVDESYDGHPAEECKWFISFEEEWTFIKRRCVHVDHGPTTYTYRDEKVTSVTLWQNRVKCQDDDDEEETTN